MTDTAAPRKMNLVNQAHITLATVREMTDGIDVQHPDHASVLELQRLATLHLENAFKSAMYLALNGIDIGKGVELDGPRKAVTLDDFEGMVQRNEAHRLAQPDSPL